MHRVKTHDNRTTRLGNRLLEALLRDCPGLRGSLVQRTEPPGVELYREGIPMSDVYFPTQGVVSIVLPLRDGLTAGVQTIGNEGMVGLPAWLNIPASPDTVLQQAPGELLGVAVGKFRQKVSRSEHARRLLNSYTAYSLRASSQTSMCNARHSVAQRLCRCMLTSADRAGSSELAMSQTMLADMIGVRRQSVSEVLAELHRDGVVGHGRNRVAVLDRARLETYSCECYQATKAVYARLVEPLL